MDLLQTVRKEGSRGGRAEFKWEDVKQDAQRENYLGHSLMAPVGRWQQGRDLNWYAKGDADAETEKSAAEKLAEEKRKIKEAEEDAMLRAMGLPVPERASTNANLTPLGEKAHEADVAKALDKKAEDEKEERPRDRKSHSHRHRDDEEKGRRRRHRSRSRSRDRRERRRERSRSRERRRGADEDRERRRRRSRSREHKHRDGRHERRRDDDRRRSRSRDYDRRRRSRSPRERRHS